MEMTTFERLSPTTPHNESIRRMVRAAARGVTLVEVLIVVAIMSLIATTVVVAVIPKFQKAQEDTALNSARELRNAVMRWRATRRGVPDRGAVGHRQGDRHRLEDRRPVGLTLQDRVRRGRGHRHLARQGQER